MDPNEVNYPEIDLFCVQVLNKRTITPRVIVGEWVKIDVNNRSRDRHRKDKKVLMHCSGKLFVFCSSAILSWTCSNWMPFGPLETIFVNTVRPRQNVRHFADGIFKCIFLNEGAWIPINISLKFVPRGPINNIPALVQIMAWRRSGDRPLFGPMMVRLPTHICVTRPQWVNTRMSFGPLDTPVILVNPKYLSALIYFTPNIQENVNEYLKKMFLWFLGYVK